jgi:uncharacterized protein
MSLFNRLFLQTFHTAEEESVVPVKGKPDRKILWITITVAISLTIIKYFGDVYYLFELLRLFGYKDLPTKIYSSDNYEIIRLGWWVGIILIGYFFIPWLVIRFVFKARLRDFGFTKGKAMDGAGLYAIMLLVMIPLVLWMATTASFQAKYPFYDLQPGETLWPRFWIWELLYFLQFCALEFFFRGFMVHGTKHRLGFYSVMYMVIPYCMIHFGKPLPETLAAIAAGLILGTLSLKSRSIWLGIAIHYSVALTMDLAAL